MNFADTSFLHNTSASDYYHSFNLPFSLLKGWNYFSCLLYLKFFYFLISWEIWITVHFPMKKILLKVNNTLIIRPSEICSILTKKNTNVTITTLWWCLYYQLSTNVTLFLNVSSVELEQLIYLLNYYYKTNVFWEQNLNKDFARKITIKIQ